MSLYKTLRFGAAVLLGALVTLGLGAQGEGPAFDDLDLDALFGDPNGTVEVEVAQEYVEAFKTAEALTWTGTYRFSIDVNGIWNKDFDDWTPDYLWQADGEQSSVNLGGDLVFSARPNADQRYLGKFKIDYPFNQAAANAEAMSAAVPVPNIRVFELFTDFNWENRVFFRAGKQVAKWGVGYFFQPADVLSLSAVDPSNPEVDREGPVMIKANLPLKSNGLEAYVIAADDLASAKEIAYALRGTLVAGNFELGAGARYQYVPDNKRGSAFQAVATATGAVGEVRVFGEGAIKYGSNKAFLVKDPLSPFPGYGTEARTDTWFPSATLGFRWNPADTYFSVLGQYYYNGEGYTEASKDLLTPGLYMLGEGDLNALDIVNISRHYGAANLGYSFKEKSKVSLGLFWIGNLQDGSGLLRPSVNIDVLDQVKLGLNAQVAYGDGFLEDEYTTLQPRLKAGFTVNLGNGEF